MRLGAIGSRAVEYTTPTFEPPYRVLVLAASSDGWYGASDDDRASSLDLFARLLERIGAAGARLVGSFDDDLFATGQPLSLPYSIYALYDVDDLGAIVQMVHDLRTSELGHMLRLEVRIGRPLFLLPN
jgi:hypothetical protein